MWCFLRTVSHDCPSSITLYRNSSTAATTLLRGRVPFSGRIRWYRRGRLDHQLQASIPCSGMQMHTSCRTLQPMPHGFAPSLIGLYPVTHSKQRGTILFPPRSGCLNLYVHTPGSVGCSDLYLKEAGTALPEGEHDSGQKLGCKNQKQNRIEANKIEANKHWRLGCCASVALRQTVAPCPCGAAPGAPGVCRGLD